MQFHDRHAVPSFSAQDMQRNNECLTNAGPEGLVEAACEPAKPADDDDDPAQIEQGLAALHQPDDNEHADAVKLLAELATEMCTLHFDKDNSLHVAVCSGRTESVNALLDQGADVCARDRLGATALHVAAENGCTETAKVLVLRGADVHARNIIGSTSVHIASFKGHTETVKALVKLGADIHALDTDGRTALHEAAGEGQVETVKALVELHVDVCAKNQDGYTALQFAVNKEHTEVVRVLEKLEMAARARNQDFDIAHGLSASQAINATLKSVTGMDATTTVQPQARASSSLSFTFELAVDGSKVHWVLQ